MSQETRNLLQQVAELQLKQSFVEGYPETHDTLLDALGIAIARYCNWTGLDILKIMYAALEDSNYHRINETVQKWIDGEA